MNTENKESLNQSESGNLAKPMLAVVLILLIWIAVLAVGVILAMIFNNEQFIIRSILIFPFSIGAVYTSCCVWMHYR
jgi:uncharacterized membrane-anchored protein